MGRARVELFRRLFPNKREGFEDLFFEELESWFSADIACCDACYDDFVDQWPAIYLRDIEFQKSGTPLDVFYDGSDLRELFTEEEFWEYAKEINCPRCGCPLTANIWPYNFPFTTPEGFEEKSEEMAQIAGKTPFLVLSHPFAKQVYDDIKRVGSKITPSKLLDNYYRARPCNEIKTVSPSALGPPPVSSTPEGRYNHSGKPVLYIANNEKTAYLELGCSSCVFYVAKIKLLSSMKILNLLDEDLGSDVLKALVYSSLLSTPSSKSDWYKSGYVFSRFVADCVYDAGLDGIKYPSVRPSDGHNLVLFNRVKDGDLICTVQNIETINIETPSKLSIHYAEPE